MRARHLLRRPKRINGSHVAGWLSTASVNWLLRTGLTAGAIVVTGVCGSSHALFGQSLSQIASPAPEVSVDLTLEGIDAQVDQVVPSTLPATIPLPSGSADAGPQVTPPRLNAAFAEAEEAAESAAVTDNRSGTSTAEGRSVSAEAATATDATEDTAVVTEVAAPPLRTSRAITSTPELQAPPSARQGSSEAEQPATARPPMPRFVASLQRPVEQCLQLHLTQRLNSGQDSCWSMMHSFLGWGEETQIHIGNSRGPLTNAIQWVAQNQACAGRRLFYLSGDRLRGREGPGYQGHPAQFLAMIAQLGVEPGMPILVSGREFTVEDLVREEQLTCYRETELTFKLIGLCHYLGSDAQWKNDRGESWSVERLLGIEIAQPVNGAACGGTHRLMAISYAVRCRESEGLPIDGVWARAKKYILDYHRYTFSLQNRNGSFSSEWFRRRADRNDVDRGIQTTGHILEWLVFSLPEEQLYDPRVARAVNYVAQSMIQNRYHDWEVGPKGHAIRALRLYQQRVFHQQDIRLAPLARRAQEGSEDR